MGPTVCPHTVTLQRMDNGHGAMVLMPGGGGGGDNGGRKQATEPGRGDHDDGG